MKMKNPPHVGDVILYEILEPPNLTVTAAARVLGVSRPALSGLLNGRALLSPKMAVRIVVDRYRPAQLPPVGARLPAIANLRGRER